MSVPPWARISGMTVASNSLGTAALTAYPVSLCRWETVGSRMHGRTAMTLSRSAPLTLTSTMTRRRASRTERRRSVSFSISGRLVALAKACLLA